MTKFILIMQRMGRSSKTALVVILTILSASCGGPKNLDMSDNSLSDPTTSGDTQIISAPIVKKNFVKKNNEVTDHEEYFVRRSIQDYFVKFCESNVDRVELQDYLDHLGDDLKVATLEVEIRNGNWDICDDNLEQQSRIGEYMIIHRIIKD